MASRVIYLHTLHLGMVEETYSVRGYGRPEKFTRASLKELLDVLGPLGSDYIEHHMSDTWIDYDDFVNACRHFGLGDRIMDIEDDEIKAEIEARKARGASPRQLTRNMERVMWDVPREEIDARLDIYERRVAEAEARRGVWETADRLSPKLSREPIWSHSCSCCRSRIENMVQKIELYAPPIKHVMAPDSLAQMPHAS